MEYILKKTLDCLQELDVQNLVCILRPKYFNLSLWRLMLSLKQQLIRYSVHYLMMMLTQCSSKFMLPGHSLTLHDWLPVSVFPPAEQGEPPFAGDGLLHSLFLDCDPLPQVVEQDDQPVQSPHLPFTRVFRRSRVMHRHVNKWTPYHSDDLLLDLATVSITSYSEMIA